jgi:hypothetical protein
MPNVPDSSLKGNAGVWLVGKWLADGGCLVRPVAADTDIGIDLYCETIEESKAFLHFFVQVKSGKQVKVKDERARISLEKRHLKYWIKQPAPVFVFLVPEVDHDKIYVIDMARWNVDGGQIRINRNNRQIVEANYCFRLNPSDSSKFLKEYVPCAHVLLNASNGICMSIPQTEPQYVRQNIRGIRGRYAEKVVDQMRTNTVYTLWDLLEIPVRHTTDLNSYKAIQPLAKLIEIFTEYDDHWETFYVMGLYYEKTGTIKMAKQKYLRARAKEIIENDPIVDQRKGRWKKHFDSVCGAIERCEASDGQHDCLD